MSACDGLLMDRVSFEASAAAAAAAAAVGAGGNTFLSHR